MEDGHTIFCLAYQPGAAAVAVQQRWDGFFKPGTQGTLGSHEGVEPKIGVFTPPNHPFVHRVFHYFHHPFWGKTALFLETSRYFEDCMFCVCLPKIYQS